jgi:hypothetical protein
VWARVTVEGQEERAASVLPASATALTDRDGAFELRGVPAGRRGVAAFAFGHHGHVVSGLDFPPGGRLGPLTIELAPIAQGERARTELFGIGVVLGSGEEDDDALVVTRVLPGGGAEAAGIVPGDAILAVDEADVGDLGFERAVQAIRGPEGTTVALRLRRADGGAEQPLVVRRAPIDPDG